MSDRDYNAIQFKCKECGKPIPLSYSKTLHLKVDDICNCEEETPFDIVVIRLEVN